MAPVRHARQPLKRAFLLQSILVGEAYLVTPPHSCNCAVRLIAWIGLIGTSSASVGKRARMNRRHWAICPTHSGTPSCLSPNILIRLSVMTGSVSAAYPAHQPAQRGRMNTWRGWRTAGGALQAHSALNQASCRERSCRHNQRISLQNEHE
jgi:hypothetical protein